MMSQDPHHAPIQIGRTLITTCPVIELARQYGLDRPAHPYHVTLIYSRAPVDWSVPTFRPDKASLVIMPRNARLDFFDDGRLLVLTFESVDLHRRWQELLNAGAETDYPAYHPHITLGPVQPDMRVGPIALRESLILGPEYRRPARPKQSSSQP